VALDRVGDRGNEYRRGDFARVATSFARLRADDVDANVECFLDVLWVADHVHDQDPGFVKLIDDFALGYTNGRNEETRFLLDDNVDEFRQLAACVIKVCLASTTTDLRKEQVDTEWRIGILQILLQCLYLLSQNLGRVSDATDHTKTARICDCRSQLRTCRNIHPCKKDRMLNPEQLCDGSRDERHHNERFTWDRRGRME